MAQSLKIENMYNCIKEDQTVIGVKKKDSRQMCIAQNYCWAKIASGRRKGEKLKLSISIMLEYTSLEILRVF